MHRLRAQVRIRSFLGDERGATAIEYGLICAMIAVVVIGVSATGGAVSLLYQKMAAIAGALVNGGGGGGDGGGG